MLGAYLWQQALLPAAGAAHSAGFRGAQGHHMGRAGRLRIDVRTRDGQLDGVTINGNAVVIFETTISLLQ
jgi:predicted PhzF superfamily epimerase YddE/YHI9